MEKMEMPKKAVLYVDDSETSQRILAAFNSVPEAVEIYLVKPGECADFLPPCLITAEGVVQKETYILDYARRIRITKMREWFECWQALPQNEKEELMYDLLGSTRVGSGILTGPGHLSLAPLHTYDHMPNPIG